MSYKFDFEDDKSKSLIQVSGSITSLLFLKQNIFQFSINISNCSLDYYNSSSLRGLNLINFF